MGRLEEVQCYLGIGTDFKVKVFRENYEFDSMPRYFLDFKEKQEGEFHLIIKQVITSEQSDYALVKHVWRNIIFL